MPAADEPSGVTPTSEGPDGPDRTDGAPAPTSDDREQSSTEHGARRRRSAPRPDGASDPVIPHGDAERVDIGWGGSSETEISRDDELIADRPPHWDR